MDKPAPVPTKFASPARTRFRACERSRMRRARASAGLELIDEALDVSFPLDELARLVGLGQVWVGCLEDDLPVGMVIASVREGAVYIEEMDVLPGHGRRGSGVVCSRVSVGGAGPGPRGGHPLDLARRAVEWAVLPQAWLPGPAAGGVDAEHAADPGAGGPTRPRY